MIPEVPSSVFAETENRFAAVSESRPAIEILAGIVSIKISNDVDPRLLSQVVRAVMGGGC